MLSKRKVQLLFSVTTLIVAIFNGCGFDNHTGGEGVDLSSTSGACLPTLSSGVTPVYDFLAGKTSVSPDAGSPRFLSCKACHYQGSAAAPSNYYFADSNPQVALTGFAYVIGADANKIFNKAYDSNHFGGSDPSNQAVMDTAKAAYLQSAEEYRTCVLNQSVGPGSPGGSTPPVSNDSPTVITTAKSIPANQTTPLSLTWDLGADIQRGTGITGGRFQITVQAVASGTGIREYLITSPSALGSSTRAIQIRNIRVYINGALISLDQGGSTWTSLNNLAPANNATTGRTVPYRLAQGTGSMHISSDTSLGTNTIAIGFGEIVESTKYPDFNPSTFARLTAAANNANATPPLNQAERVFAVRCQACHGGGAPSAGMNLTAGANNLQLLKLLARVVPFVPESSLLHTRITSAGATVMPPTGPIPAEEIRWIRDWILDGAP